MFKGLFDTANALTRIGSLSGNVNQVANAIRGLSNENKLLALSTTSLGREGKKLALVRSGMTWSEAKLLLATQATTAATNADTIAATANARMTNTLTVAKTKLHAVIAAHPYMLMAAGMAAAVAALVIWDRKVQQSIQESIDKSKELANTYKEQQETFQSNKNAISTLSAEYERLSQGTDAFGNNISLTGEEFKRYHEITSQIADMFPQMVQGYDEQGNAILKNKGNVEALTQALKEQRRAANHDILSGSNDMFRGVENEVAQVLDDIRAVDAALAFINGDTVESGNTKAIAQLKKRNIEMQAIGASAGVTTYKIKTDGSLAEQQRIGEAINSLMYERNNLLLKEEEIQKRVNVVTQAYLGNNTAYNAMTGAQQSMVSVIASALNPKDFAYDDAAMQDFIRNNIIIPISENKEGVNSALTELFHLSADDLPADSYRTQVDRLVEEISGKLGTDGVKLRVALGLEEDYTSISTALEGLQEKVSAEVFENLQGLSGDELKIAYEIENIGSLTWEQLEEKITKVKSEKIALAIQADTADTLKAIDQLNQGLEKIKKVFQDVQDGGEFDFGSIISSDFQELFGGATEAYNRFIETVANSPDDIDAVKKSFDELIQIQIDESGILNSVHDGNKKVIQSYLEEMGVVNASEVTHQAYIQTKIKAFLAGRDLASILPEEINAFLAENQVLGINELMLNAVALAKETLNGTSLNFQKDIEAIIGFVEKLGAGTAALKMMNDVKKAGEQGNSYAWSGMGDIAAAAKKEVQDALNSVMSVKIATPSIDYGKFSPQKASSGGTKSATDALKSEIDLIKEKYDTEKAGIDDTIHYMDYLKKRIPENSAEMLRHNEDMLEILDRSIANRKGKLNALLAIDGIMEDNSSLIYEVQKEIRDLESQQYEMKLSNIELMIAVDKAKFSGTDEIIQQLENQLSLAVANEDIDLQFDINTSLKEHGMIQLEAVSAMIAKYKALRDLQVEGSNEYVTLTKAINDLYKEQGSLIDEQIDKIEKLSKVQAEKDVYGETGKDAWEKAHESKIAAIKAEIEQLKSLNEEREKENAIAEKQLEIQELEEKLKNLRENKDIKILKKQDDGTWDWEYIENYKEIGETEKALNASRLELERLYEQQRADSKIEALERQIELMEQEEETRKAQYERLQKDLEDKNKRELNETVTHFLNMGAETKGGLRDLNKVVNSGMANLYESYDVWLSDIYKKVTSYVSKIKKKLAEVGMHSVPSSISGTETSAKTKTTSAAGRTAAVTPTTFQLAYNGSDVGANYATSMARTASYVPQAPAYASSSVETANNNNGDIIHVGSVQIDVSGAGSPVDVAKEISSIFTGLANEARLKSAKR